MRGSPAGNFCSILHMHDHFSKFFICHPKRRTGFCCNNDESQGGLQEAAGGQEEAEAEVEGGAHAQQEDCHIESTIQVQ